MGQSHAAGTDPEVSLVVPVRVQPRGSRSEIQGVKDGRLRIKTTAPPSDGRANKDVIRQLAKEFGVPPAHGRANKDVIRQLAKEFGVPPSRIALKCGASQRNKTFVISTPAVLPSWLTDIGINRV